MSRRNNNQSMFLNKSNYNPRESISQKNSLINKNFMKHLTTILKRTDDDVNSRIDKYKKLYENEQMKQTEFVNKVKAASTSMKEKISRVASEKSKAIDENKSLLKLMKDSQLKNKQLEKEFNSLKDKYNETSNILKNLQKERQSALNNNNNSSSNNSNKKRKIDKISRDNDTNSDNENDVLPFH